MGNLHSKSVSLKLMPISSDKNYFKRKQIKILRLRR